MDPPDFSREVVCVLGLPFDVVSTNQAVERVLRSIHRRERLFLSTVNVNFAILARSDEAFRQSILNSHLCVADGMPIVWISRILGLPIRERVAGSTLFQTIASSTNHPPVRVFIFGGPDGVAKQACERLNASAGGMKCVGYESPGYGSIEDMSSEECVRRINVTDPDFVVVALGAKKGQAWIEHNRERLTAPVISHLGAVVDFTAGTIQRAPRFMQRLGLEWLWRIVQQPSLYKRYLNDIRALGSIGMKQVLPLWWHHVWSSGRRDGGGIRGRLMEGPAELRVIMLMPCADEEGVPLRDALKMAAECEDQVTLDFSCLIDIDAAAVATILLMEGHRRALGWPFVVEGKSVSLHARLVQLGVVGLLREAAVE